MLSAPYAIVQVGGTLSNGIGGGSARLVGCCGLWQLQVNSFIK
jgi:hypothetical protein